MRFYLDRYCPLCLTRQHVPIDEEIPKDGSNRTVRVRCRKCGSVFYVWEGNTPGKPTRDEIVPGLRPGSYNTKR